jgi:dolichyl-diphosphooligosaccharide--protein glycosyltransferase
VLAGVFLGIYLLAWQGGLFFVFIIFACLVIQGIVDHLRHRSGDYLCIVGTPLFLIASLMLLPVLGSGSLDTISRVALPIAIIVPIALSIISRLMAGRALKPVYYPLALLVLLGIGLAVLAAINSSLFRSMVSLFSIFGQSGAMLTVQEASPILFPFGQFTFVIAWANFTASFFISFVALGMLIYLAVKKEEGADKVLFLVWSIIALMAVLGQRRFGYYFAVNAALLTGYFSWKMLDIAGLGKLLGKPKAVVAAVKKFKKREKKRKEREKQRQRTFMQPRGVWATVIIVGIVIFFLVFFPNISRARALASSESPIMNEGWYTSSLWLKDNTPEPFGDPDFYYELYPPRDEFQYPGTAYGVMSWWDYGYFIMQIGHRIPNANPGQAGAVQAGTFFTAQDESSANEIANERGTRYVVIDSLMATPSKFYAMAEWAGTNSSQFYEVYYYIPQTGGTTLQPVALYYPTYYQSTVVRLYNFDGEAVIPTESLVISYEEKVTPSGQKYKQITSRESFSTYEAAQAYLAGQASGNYLIVGTSVFSSPVPLEEMGSYELVHESEATTTVGGQTLPTVKIFQYLG